MWITYTGGGITKYVVAHPSGMGYTPHMGPPPPRIPPYILSECQFWGDNPQYDTKKFLGKKLTLFRVFIIKQFLYEKDSKIKGTGFGEIG